MNLILPKEPQVNTNPLEEALNSLDLQGTLVLLALLSQRALYLQQEELKHKTKVQKILSS